MIRRLTPRTTSRLVALLLCLLTMGLVTGPAHAQWVVTDPAMQAEVTANQIRQIESMIQQYTQMITQYTSMLSTIGSLGDIGLSAINNEKMDLISDATAIVSQNCPTTTDTDPVGAVVGALGLNPAPMSIDIQAAQYQICKSITTLQIHKYNTVAQILNEMNDYAFVLDSLDQKADELIGAVSGAVGNRETLGNQQNQAHAQFVAKMSNAQKELDADDADDAAISQLQAQQSMLGHIAVHGSHSMIGNAMETVIFAAALSD